MVHAAVTMKWWCAAPSPTFVSKMKWFPEWKAVIPYTILAIKFLTAGYEQSVEEVVNGALFSSDIDEMVVLKNIEIYSLCEHHLLPFVGQCHIAYLPQGKVLGISKIARLVEVFTRRLQIQENLTKQIADTLLEVTGASGVGVLIEAQHFCMMMRGIQKQNSVLSTSVMLGEFRNNPQTRNEFYPQPRFTQKC